MSRCRIALLTCLLAAGLTAGPASAAEVLHVDGERAALVEDPYLPAAAATELPPVPAGTAVVPAAPARASARMSVRGAIAAARRRGSLSAGEAADLRRLYAEARSARAKLSGSRRAQLAAVIATTERLAARGQLSAGRMPAVFLQLRRNTEFFARRRPPRNATRVTFAGSPVVFQYYSGLGLQFQPLANFGKLNALYYGCRGGRRGCKKQAVSDYADWMLALSSRRASFATWEYFFSFGGGTPPWTSGISQGTGIQALARAYWVTRDRAYLRAASRALGAFDKAPPAGLRKRVRGGNHYLLYSFAPRLEVLNSFLQSLIGLYDYAKIARSDRATRLFRSGDRVARRSLPAYDTGRWSRYSKGGRVADLGYHKLQTDFLENLCRRTAHRVYCRYAARFNAYLERRQGGGGDGGGRPEGPRAPTPTEPGQQPDSGDWTISVRRVGTRRVLDFSRGR